MVSVVGCLLRRRSMGAGAQQLEGAGHISPSVSLRCGSRPRARRFKAAVYWHERWQNADGSYSNLRVNSSIESLRAYRGGIAHADWLGDLILRAIPKQ